MDVNEEVLSFIAGTLITFFQMIEHASSQSFFKYQSYIRCCIAWKNISVQEWFDPHPALVKQYALKYYTESSEVRRMEFRQCLSFWIR